MKRLLYITLMLAMGLVGCTREAEVEPARPTQKGDLTLSFNTVSISGVEESRAALGDGKLWTGGGINDLVVVLTDPLDIVVEKIEVDFDRIPDGDTDLTDNVGELNYTHTFTGLDVGRYNLYAYANIKNSAVSSASARLAKVKPGVLFTALEPVEINGIMYERDMTKDLFSPLTNTIDMANDYNPTPDKSRPMFISGSAIADVGVGSSTATVELKRPMVWFDMELYNHSNYALTIDALTFSKFCPATSFVLPNDHIFSQDQIWPTGSGITYADGTVNSGTNCYRSLPAYPHDYLDMTTGVITEQSTPITIAANSSANIYRTFLFENQAPSYTFDMKCTSTATKTVTTTTFNGVNAHASSIDTSTNYILGQTVSGTLTYYLADDGSGNMTLLTSLDAENYTRAQWKFSGTTSGYLTNVATGKRFYRDTESAESGSNLTFSHQGDGEYRIYYTSGTRTYYLWRDNGTVTFERNVYSNRDWQLYTAKFNINTEYVDVVADLKDQPISYINSMGVPEPLTQMRRNEHITLKVNVYYEEVDGTFRFYLEPWEEVENGVVFN